MCTNKSNQVYVISAGRENMAPDPMSKAQDEQMNVFSVDPRKSSFEQMGIHNAHNYISEFI